MRTSLFIAAFAVATFAVAQELPSKHVDTTGLLLYNSHHHPIPYIPSSSFGQSLPDFDYGAPVSGESAIASGKRPLPGTYLLKDSLTYKSSYKHFMTVYAAGEHLMGLGDKRQAVIGSSYSKGNWTVDAGLGVEKYYLWRSTRNNAFVNASVTYRFSEQWSMTAFGIYSFNPFFHSLAMNPYVTTSRYGGTLNWQSNGRFGLRLGVQREYDLISQRWITRPVVAPSYKVGKIKIEIDTGPIIQEGILRLLNKRRNDGPMIMPR